jgi:hypothetical protein
VASLDAVYHQMCTSLQKSHELDVLTATDHGGRIILWGTKDGPLRIHFSLGLSASVFDEDYIFQDGKLVMTLESVLRPEFDKDGNALWNKGLWLEGERLSYYRRGVLFRCIDRGDCSELYSEPDRAKDEFRFCEFIVKHWDDRSLINLELWLKDGELPE